MVMVSATMATEVNSSSIHRVQEALEKFAVFLERHQWVESVNTVGFFTEKMWDGLIVPHFGDVATEIVQLTEEEMARLPAGNIPPRRDGERELSGLRKFIEECTEHRLESTRVLCTVPDVLNEIEAAQYVEQRQYKTEVQATTTVVPPRVMMNIKKCHEVEEMSRFTARLSKMHQLQKVVDVGSGKGYLGQYLTFQYGLDVIGIDSSDSNTHGAQDRIHRLGKKWEGISKHSMNIQQRCSQSENPKETFKEIFTRRAQKINSMQKFGKCTNKLGDPLLKPACKGSGTGINMHESDPQSEGACNNLTTNQEDTSSIQNNISQSECLSIESSWKLMNMQHPDSQSSCPSVPTNSTDINLGDEMIEDLMKISAYLDEEDDKDPDSSSKSFNCRDQAQSQGFSLGQTITRNSGKKQYSHSASTAQESSTNSHCSSHDGSHVTQSGASFCSVTAFVEPSTSLPSLMSETSGESHQENALHEPFMLIGLHTCGDLAPSSLRLFVHNDLARVLLNVGCCYQHITEEFETEGWILPDTRPEVFGFPMSRLLRSRRTKIMRPARMLASKAADRIATSRIVPAMGLFYRSVLQVLLQDHFRLPKRSEHVGKLAPKCQNFLQYARKALKKLHFDDSKLSDAEISTYSDRFQPYFSQLQALNQLRVALAPTIEGLIMLDRLCYLQEQVGVRRAAVVKLFDPVTSPRCYAIMATK